MHVQACFFGMPTTSNLIWIIVHYARQEIETPALWESLVNPQCSVIEQHALTARPSIVLVFTTGRQLQGGDHRIVSRVLSTCYDYRCSNRALCTLDTPTLARHCFKLGIQKLEVSTLPAR
jgi:hypothetical protein